MAQDLEAPFTATLERFRTSTDTRTDTNTINVSVHVSVFFRVVFCNAYTSNVTPRHSPSIYRDCDPGHIPKSYNMTRLISLLSIPHSTESCLAKLQIDNNLSHEHGRSFSTLGRLVDIVNKLIIRYLNS